jgi:hypothetical protein
MMIARDYSVLQLWILFFLGLLMAGVSYQCTQSLFQSPICLMTDTGTPAKNIYVAPMRPIICMPYLSARRPSRVVKVYSWWRTYSKDDDIW